jgi:hypothetical protein
MQRREFIAAVGVVAAGAVSQSNRHLRATYRCHCASHRPRNHFHFAEPGDGPRIRFGLERVIRYAAFCSSRANNTNSEAVRGSLMVAMPALFDERRHSIIR